MDTASIVRRLARLSKLLRSSKDSNGSWPALGSDLANSKGNLRRWSVRNSIGGVIVATACEQIVVHGITWEAVCLCFVGVLPLIFSMFET